MVGIRISPATNLQLAHLTAGTQPAACIPFTHNTLRTGERDAESNTRFVTRNRVVLALSPLGKGAEIHVGTRASFVVWRKSAGASRGCTCFNHHL